MEVTYSFASSKEILKRFERLLEIPEGQLPKRYNAYYLNEFIEQNLLFLSPPYYPEMVTQLQTLHGRVCVEYPLAKELAEKIQLILFANLDLERIRENETVERQSLFDFNINDFDTTLFTRNESSGEFSSGEISFSE